MRKLRRLASIAFLITTLLTTFALAQGNLTQIRDTIYNANGTPFNGTVVITWNGYSTTLSGTISPLSTSARIYNGALSVLLVPTTTAAAGSYYQVVYSSSDGTVQWTETWQVPPSANALSVPGVRTSTTPGGGSTSGSGSSGTGTGSTQYATLPVSMNQVTGLTSSLSTINTSLSTLNSTTTTLTSSVTSLTTTANTNTANIGTLQTNLGMLQNNVSTLQTNVVNLTGTVNSLSSGSTAGSTIVFVDAESPAGTVNGSNTAFTLAATPSPVSSLELYRNGVMQAVGIDYTLSGNTLTFLPVAIPKTGDVLQAFYRKTGASAPLPAFTDSEVPAGTIDGTNAAFTLAAPPNPAKSLKLYKNGILLQQPGDYSLSGAAITFTNPAIPQSGDSVSAYYRH